jgi:hypothetical protein
MFQNGRNGRANRTMGVHMPMIPTTELLSDELNNFRIIGLETNWIRTGMAILRTETVQAASRYDNPPQEKA